MINGMDVALRHIHAEIPRRILEIVFREGYAIDEAIKKDVIYKFVIPDCNLKSGKVLPIELLSEWAIPAGNDYWSIFRIPEEAREGRNIIEVHQITRKYDQTVIGVPADMPPLPIQHPMNAFSHSPSMIYATNAMLESKTGTGQLPHMPIPELMGGNIVKLHPSPGTYLPWTLTCRVCYDKEMTNLNSAAIEAFADSCVAGVKRHCYNQLILEMDAGAIQFGAELVSLKDIITRWGDVQQEYNEAKKAFTQGTMLDIRRFESIARGML